MYIIMHNDDILKVMGIHISLENIRFNFAILYVSIVILLLNSNM